MCTWGQAQQVAVREQLVELGVSEYSTKSNLSFINDDEVSEAYKRNPSHLSLDTIRHILLDLGMPFCPYCTSCLGNISNRSHNYLSLQDRSFPTHRQFIDGLPEGVEGRAAMFRILAAYARYNHEVGYCQGKCELSSVPCFNAKLFVAFKS